MRRIWDALVVGKYWTGAHTKHRWQYHLVWTPKYRKRMLLGKVAIRLTHLLYETARVNRWSIRELVMDTIIFGGIPMGKNRRQFTKEFKIENECSRMKLIALIVFGLSLIGCASDIANRYYVSERYPPKNKEDVLILDSNPTRSFIVIADFQSRGENPSDLQERAAAIGADAVIVSHVGGYYSRSEEWASEDRYKGEFHDHILGTAIKFMEENGNEN